MSYLNEIIYLLGPRRKYIPGLVLLFVLVALLDVVGIGLIVPFIGLLIDSEGNTDSQLSRLLARFGSSSVSTEEYIPFYGAIIIAVFAIKGLLSITAQWLVIRFSNQHMVFLRARLMTVFLSMAFEKYIARNSSEYIFAMQNLTATYCARVLLPGLRAISDAILIVCLIALLAYSARDLIFFLFAVIVVVVALYDILLKNKMKMLGVRRNRSAKKVIRSLTEGIKGLRELRMLQVEDAFVSELKMHAQQNARYETVSTTINVSSKYVVEFILVAFLIVSISMALYLQVPLESLASTATVMALGIIRLLPATNSLIGNLLALRLNRNTVGLLVRDCVDLPVFGPFGGEGFESRAAKNFEQIIFDDVSYKYPSSEAATLSNLNFTIERGQAIGIVGGSGAGKTTLVNVMMGLLDPSSGDVLIKVEESDGKLCSADLSVAYVPQDIFIQDASLRENIALGLSGSERNLEFLYNCLAKASLMDWASSLPEGIETRLGEGGALISGGQRQRVAIARALYHQKDLIIFDECTSALDESTAGNIYQQISRLKGEKTVVIISHQPKMLSFCDVVLELRNGHVLTTQTEESR